MPSARASVVRFGKNKGGKFRASIAKGHAMKMSAGRRYKPPTGDDGLRKLVTSAISKLPVPKPSLGGKPPVPLNQGGPGNAAAHRHVNMPSTSNWDHHKQNSGSKIKPPAPARPQPAPGLRFGVGRNMLPERDSRGRFA